MTPAFDPLYPPLALRRAKLLGSRDVLGGRRRLEAALGDGSAIRGPIPRRSVLLVRRLRLELPLRMAEHRPDEGFRDAVATNVARLHRAAARPWRHDAGAAADAVRFADDAELAACIVRDGLRNVLGERWWPRLVLDDLSAADWSRRHLLPRGDLVPAVLSLLAEQGWAVQWVGHMGERDAMVAVDAILHAHGLSHPEPPMHHTAVERGDGGSTGHRGLPPAVRQAAQDRLVAIIPELLAPALPRSGRLLLALGLGLRRDPGWIRSAALYEALAVLEPRAAENAHVRSGAAETVPSTATHPGADHRWHTPSAPQGPGGQPFAAAEPRRAGVAHPRRPQRVIGDAPQRTDGLGSDSASTPAYARLGPADRDAPSAVSRRTGPAGIDGIRNGPSSDAVGAPMRHLASHAVHSRPSADNTLPPATGARTADAVALPTQARRPGTGATGAGRRHGQAAPPSFAAAASAPRSSLAAAAFPSDTLDTRWGGLLYLLNVALALGLYGDFTQPRRPGIALWPWDWLALVGRRWLGAGLHTDPLWVLLGRLAVRRDGEPPGAAFAPPDTWLVPADWPAPWGAAPVQVEASRGRLRLRHPAAFLLADVPRRAGVSPRVQARGLLARWPALHLDVAFRPTRPIARGRQPGWQPRPRPLERWLDWLLPYLEARLALALGRDDATTVPRLVCRHRARIEVSSTALDVHLSLAELPIAVRIAGLDRDPGWIPAAGRTVAFHFR